MKFVFVVDATVIYEASTAEELESAYEEYPGGTVMTWAQFMLL